MSAIFDGPDMFDPAIFDTKISHSVSLIESVAVSDSVARQTAQKRNIIDSDAGIFDGEIFDSAIFDVDFATINIEDSVVTKFGISRILTENVPVFDTVARRLGSFRIIIEPAISIGELLVRKLTATRTIIENVPVSDSVARRLGSFRTIIENVPVFDSVARMLSSFRTVIEPAISIGELLVRKLTAFRTITEVVVISDVVTILRDVSASKTATANLCIETEVNSNLCIDDTAESDLCI